MIKSKIEPGSAGVLDPAGEFSDVRQAASLSLMFAIKPLGFDRQPTTSWQLVGHAPRSLSA